MVCIYLRIIILERILYIIHVKIGVPIHVTGEILTLEIINLISNILDTNTSSKHKFNINSIDL